MSKDDGATVLALDMLRRENRALRRLVRCYLFVEEAEPSAAAGLRLESRILELKQRVFANIDAADGPSALFELVRRFDLGLEVLEKAEIWRPNRFGSLET
jgi:hypothetical protein